MSDDIEKTDAWLGTLDGAQREADEADVDSDILDPNVKMRWWYEIEDLVKVIWTGPGRVYVWEPFSETPATTVDGDGADAIQAVLMTVHDGDQVRDDWTLAALIKLLDGVLPAETVAALHDLAAVPSTYACGIEPIDDDDDEAELMALLRTESTDAEIAENQAQSNAMELRVRVIMRALAERPTPVTLAEMDAIVRALAADPTLEITEVELIARGLAKRPTPA
jgi:hypothetical protein